MPLASNRGELQHVKTGGSWSGGELKLADFRGLVQNMPVRAHAVWTRRLAWNALASRGDVAAEAINRVFEFGPDSNGIRLSRGDLRQFGESGDLDAYLMACLMWGYPRGMRGTHGSRICDGLVAIREQVGSAAAAGVDDWSSHYRSVCVLPGLGLSTYSKFLAFLSVRVGGSEALILDEAVARACGDGRFEELAELQGLNYSTAPGRYLEYLRRVEQTARDLGSAPEQLEMFLFCFGRNLKSADGGRLHEHVPDTAANGWRD